MGQRNVGREPALISAKTAKNRSYHVMAVLGQQLSQ
jgi:hypothetical protein